MSTENLWGQLPEIESIRTPLHILKEQAAKLGEMTGKILEAEITKPVQSSIQSDRCDVEMDIVAPTMNYYRITILRMNYPISKFYPVNLSNVLDQSEERVIRDERQFNEYLNEILSSDEVQRVIKSLLTYAKAG